jgi:hypothetical protein
MVPEPGGPEGHERHRVPGAATEDAAETARMTRRMMPATLERVRRLQSASGHGTGRDAFFL